MEPCAESVFFAWGGLVGAPSLVASGRWFAWCSERNATIDAVLERFLNIHMSYEIQSAAELLLHADSICISSGAGMSAESGVPTFRDADGLWSKFRPEELATPEAFRRDPLKVWEWYRLRRQALARCEPHEGHRVLAAWEARVADFSLVTQNVDGLHSRVGSRNVIELHGRLDHTRCSGCQYACWGLADLGPDPRCPQCAQRLRPGVVWFGEMLPADLLERAIDAARHCTVILLIGTSGVVQPAAMLAELAKERGATVIEINPKPTPISAFADVLIRSGCRAALTGIEEEWNESK